MVALIVTCEIGFWIFLLAGLAVRYLLRRRRTGAALLLGAPLLDVVLLGAAAVDLRRGGVPDFAHGLAAIYLGITVVFGHEMVRWADTRFAHRFAGGPAPVPPPRTGRAHAARERRQWLRHLLAYAISAALLAAFTPLAGGFDRAAPLWQAMGPWTLILLIDMVISLSYTLAPRRP
ncbi:hypothetical protein ACWT_1082 [Actinoplanes sp. SE50]|uniref:hypothetical protein n=1 Tax=unclassified Actinoplanes TaxID=2626549 RepID=UPI00023ECDEA|nr:MULTISPECIES: hypothetical protein [unclassified Actinoplanes]AEV82098.1 hypothetical protein ACPL_1201 [Actinoplanes sp. SE50/110]ATO80497.1 hypothetical protein ACWT_1082 [Actinoplanes sp. SE50]SLL97904.1 hypothetical protein ACSP50_1118 [Actinoplanes sp. SE50/110]